MHKLLFALIAYVLCITCQKVSSTSDAFVRRSQPSSKSINEYAILPDCSSGDKDITRHLKSNAEVVRGYTGQDLSRTTTSAENELVPFFISPPMISSPEIHLASTSELEASEYLSFVQAVANGEEWQLPYLLEDKEARLLKSQYDYNVRALQRILIGYSNRVPSSLPDRLDVKQLALNAIHAYKRLREWYIGAINEKKLERQ